MQLKQHKFKQIYISMKKLRNTLLALILVGSSNFIFSQDDIKKEPNVKFDIGADLMSRYVWRGIQYGGNAPSIQPSMSMTWKGLEVGFWGAYSTASLNTVQEIDFYVSYTFLKDMLSIGVTDYFFPAEGGDFKPFDYRADSTSHVLEAFISYNGIEKVPVSLMIAVNIYGGDAPRINDDPTSNEFNKKTGIQYSTYIELAYSEDFKYFSFDAFAGFSLASPKSKNDKTGYIGEPGFYDSKAGLINLGVTFGKEIPITPKYSLPINASIITNPLANKIYLVFGISI